MLQVGVTWDLCARVSFCFLQIKKVQMDRDNLFQDNEDQASKTISPYNDDHLSNQLCQAPNLPPGEG